MTRLKVRPPFTVNLKRSDDRNSLNSKVRSNQVS